VNYFLVQIIVNFSIDDWTSCHLQNLKSKGNFGAFGLAAIKLDKIRLCEDVSY